MRRYDIVTGILLILSTIDFTLAAPTPVLVQEKSQAPVDVVQIPKDVTTMLGKRWDEELERLGENYFKTGTYSSSNSAPLGPDRGSTDVVPPAWNTANPNPLTEPSRACSSSVQGLSARGNCLGGLAKKVFDAIFLKPTYKRPYYSSTSSDYSDSSSHSPSPYVGSPPTERESEVVPRPPPS